MRIFNIFILIIITIFISFFNVYAENNKYNIEYNSDFYFWKDEIVDNDFFPNIPDNIKKDLLQYFKNNKKNINFINLNISNKDHIKLFTNYYWKWKRSSKPKVNVNWFIFENWNIKDVENFKGTVKIKWNFSLQSLKIWLALNVEWDLKKWFFKNKDKFALRHIMYDVTGVSEKTYLDSYTESYEKIFWFKPYHIKWKYYWLLINWKIYWYYLMLDNTKNDLLKNNWNKKNKETCIVKAKIRDEKKRADLTLNFWKNRKEIMEDEKMWNIYKIEEWDKKKCLTDFRELLTKIEKKDFEWVKENFYNINEIYLWQKYLYETNNYWWLYQNYVLIKHNWKWNLTLWDWDLTLQEMNTPFNKIKLKNNWLINLILLNKNKIKKHYIKKIDNFDFRKKIEQNLTKNYKENKEEITFDRIIWFKYVKKEIWNRNKEFYKYAQGIDNVEILKKNIKKVFWNIFNWNKYLN